MRFLRGLDLLSKSLHVDVGPACVGTVALPEYGGGKRRVALSAFLHGDSIAPVANFVNRAVTNNP